MFTPEINDTYDAALIDALGREELGNEMEGPTYVMIDNFFEDLYDGNMHRALGYCDPAVFNDPVDLRFILAGDDEAEGTPNDGYSLCGTSGKGFWTTSTAFASRRVRRWTVKPIETARC